MEKDAWFYCKSVQYVVLKHFYVNLIDSFWENQCFSSKYTFRPSKYDYKWYVFSEKLTVNQWKKCLVLLYFCT